jgi:hypothetical protein
VSLNGEIGSLPKKIFTLPKNGEIGYKFRRKNKQTLPIQIMQRLILTKLLCFCDGGVNVFERKFHALEIFSLLIDDLFLLWYLAWKYATYMKKGINIVSELKVAVYSAILVGLICFHIFTLDRPIEKTECLHHNNTIAFIQLLLLVFFFFFFFFADVTADSKFNFTRGNNSSFHSYALFL